MKFLAKIVVIIAVFFIGFYVGQQQVFSPASQPKSTDQSIVALEAKVNLMLDFGNGEVKTFNNVTIPAKATVFDLLKQVTTENKWDFKFKDYGQEMGVFVESINGVANNLGANRYWQYWLNNNYATVGASLYQLQNGDLVEWKYIKGQVKN